MLARANITAWSREEDGSYQAEINEWKLHVTWTPEPTRGGPYGYSWKAEGPGGEKLGSAEFLEEAEVAMMAAEAAARPPLGESRATREPEGEGDEAG
jgi:hypothetical protein